VLSAADAGQFPRDGLPEVAFLGRSNVGKSSLLNALAGRRGLARISSSPGCTQTVNFFRVGDEMYWADLPGYGYAKVPESVRLGWDRLASSYLVGREPLALSVFLVDLRHEPSEGDRTLQAFLDHHGVAYLLAASKADKLGRDERGRRLRALREGIGRRAQDVLATSAQSGDGIAELRRAIRERVLAFRRPKTPPKPGPTRP
jgi:GTP-binding protein